MKTNKTIRTAIAAAIMAASSMTAFANHSGDTPSFFYNRTYSDSGALTSVTVYDKQSNGMLEPVRRRSYSTLPDGSTLIAMEAMRNGRWVHIAEYTYSQAGTATCDITYRKFDGKGRTTECRRKLDHLNSRHELLSTCNMDYDSSTGNWTVTELTTMQDDMMSTID